MKMVKRPLRDPDTSRNSKKSSSDRLNSTGRRCKDSLLMLAMINDGHIYIGVGKFNGRPVKEPQNT